MTCMCGDPYCPSCGPAQGVHPDGERILNAMLTLAKPEGEAEQEGCDKLVRALGQFSRIADLLDVLAGLIRVGGEPIDVAQVNAALDAVRPCPEHGCWPDPDLGCAACFDRDINKDIHADFEASRQKRDGSRRPCTGCGESLHFDEIVFIWNDEALCEKCNEARIERAIREGERC